jgi:hypothetical protein
MSRRPKAWTCPRSKVSARSNVNHTVHPTGQTSRHCTSFHTDCLRKKQIGMPLFTLADFQKLFFQLGPFQNFAGQRGGLLAHPLFQFPLYFCGIGMKFASLMIIVAILPILLERELCGYGHQNRNVQASQRGGKNSFQPEQKQCLPRAYLQILLSAYSIQ